MRVNAVTEQGIETKQTNNNKTKQKNKMHATLLLELNER